MNQQKQIVDAVVMKTCVLCEQTKEVSQEETKQWHKLLGKYDTCPDCAKRLVLIVERMLEKERQGDGENDGSTTKTSGGES